MKIDAHITYWINIKTKLQENQFTFIEIKEMLCDEMFVLLIDAIFEQLKAVSFNIFLQFIMYHNT